MSVVVVVLWALVHLPLFFFCFCFLFFFFALFLFLFLFFGRVVQVQARSRVRDGEVDSPFCCYLLPIGQIICYPPPHKPISLSLSHIIKIKWMVRVKDHGQKLLSMKARRERERERVSGVHFCEIMCVYFTYLFTSFLTCPCTSPTLGLTLGVFELCQRFMIILS